MAAFILTPLKKAFVKKLRCKLKFSVFKYKREKDRPLGTYHMQGSVLGVTEGSKS